MHIDFFFRNMMGNLFSNNKEVKQNNGEVTNREDIDKYTCDRCD